MPALHEPPFPPTPYQIAAREAVETCFAEHRSTLVVLPTGCGKTFLFSWVAQQRLIERGARRVLVIAHRRELIDQAARTLRTFGLTVEIEMAQRRARRRAMMPSEAVVASVQTLQRKRLEQWDPDAFDLVIVDEGHHGTAQTYRTILDYFDAPALFLTATPDRTDGVGLHNICESVAYAYEIRDAIADGFLVPPAVQTVEVAALDLSRVKTKTGKDLGEKALRAAMAVDGVAHQIAGPLVELAGERRTVVFCPSVQNAQQLADVLGGYVDDRQVAVIHGGTDDHTRATVVERFAAGDLRYLINCMVLTEGWDAPGVECVAVCRPTKSRSLYTQMIGRGLRVLRRPDGTIDREAKAECLVLDFVGNAGKHRLVNPWDVLAGKELADVELKALEGSQEAREKLRRGDIEALEHEAQRRAQEALESDEAERLRKEIFAEAKFKTSQIDPFDLRRLSSEGASRETLWELGRMHVPMERVRDAEHAQQIVEWDRGRERHGMATYRQARLLRRYGLSTQITKREATEIIGRLAKSGWKHVPDDIRLRYGSP